jgi:hypothetical protein
MAIQIKLLMYGSFLRPLLCYAWSYIADTHIHNLAKLQNCTIRQIINAPWYFRITDIHRDLAYPTIQKFLQNLAIKFHKNMDNEHILALTDYDPANKKRPMSILAREFKLFLYINTLKVLIFVVLCIKNSKNKTYSVR